MHVLVVEDDRQTADYVANGLKQSGNVVDISSDGHDALISGMQGQYDVIVVDRMLPGLDGLSLVKALRAANIKTPILFLSALGQVDQRVDGLNAGADDYLAKPFVFSELNARVNALGRRPPIAIEKTDMQVGDLQLDVIRRIAKRDGHSVDLLPREYAILEFLMRNEGRVVTRTMLLEQVWGLNFDPQSSVVETHISRLRSKIDKPFAVTLIHTVRNMGYSLHAPR